MSTIKPSYDDGYQTRTSLEQHSTENVIVSLISDATPTLARNSHLNFLARALFQGFPKRYATQDASQPWLIFWILQAFSALGAGLDPGNKQRAIDTVLAAQHPDGGFGGGPQQAPHVLPTYAAVCALAIVGGWDKIDRRGIYDFFISLKQKDGSFRVAKHAEVDIRGTYCLLATATLLNILTPTLTADVPGFVKSCQTYEGGFASASQPYYAAAEGSPLLISPRPPLGEAHGGYTSCALNSWVLLQPFLQDGQRINVKNLLRWLVKMQGGSMDLRGFKGRTNKLVDGCYSWWVGGCFASLEGLGVTAGMGGQKHPYHHSNEDAYEDNNEWSDIDEELFDKKGLQEYILIAAQAPAGGLRDKPPKNPDAYHTLYNLAGLSAAQHRVYPSADRRKKLEEIWVDNGDDPLELDDTESSQERIARRKQVYLDAMAWAEDEDEGKRANILGDQSNRVNATHPLFNLTLTHSRAMMVHFYGQKAIV